MMDSDEDDIYPVHEEANGNQGRSEVKMEDADEEEEGEEVEDSEDDVDFIIDAKDEPQAEPLSQTKRAPAHASAAAPDVRKASGTPTPAIKAATPALDSRGRSQTPNERPGTEYPARHTSKIDPNGNPVHPATGKPILSTDFDTDFPTESTKAWRRPGADITDYFNYGFDEFTWASYCLKQQQMPKEVKEITQQAEQMKAFVEGIPGGGMPGMPGMPGPGAADMSQMAMPSEAQMQQMFQAMTSQGMDPSAMDPAQFMQFMSAGGGGGMMGGQQPPTGPAASFGGGGGSGFDQGGGGGGGGGGGFGRGRGKGGRRNW